MTDAAGRNPHPTLPQRVGEGNSQWRIVDLIAWGKDYLARRQVPQPRLSMELILSKVLAIKRLDLYLQFERTLTAGELGQVKAMLQKRALHIPIQYLLGEWDFFGMTFGVSEHALIPRPETEMLAQSLLKVLAAHGIHSSTYGLDLGTGSGNLAIALLAHLPESRCIAVELSSEALQLARINADRHGMADRIEFCQGNWFEPLSGRSPGTLDWIVSNPPYVPAEQWDALPQEVRLHEPRLALWGGACGMDAYETLVAGASLHLKQGGWLALEIGEDQGPIVRACVEACAGMRFAEIIRDHNGADRVVLAQKA